MKKLNVNRRRAKGYTLIELLIVITIISVLLGVAVVSFQGAPDEAKMVAAGQEIRNMELALERYNGHNSRYPSNDQGLKALVEQPSDAKRWPKGGYLKGGKVPLDPWGNPYKYLYPGNNGAYDIYSLGPDGRESDDDINSWNLE